MTRILIADDEPLARERLKMLLVGQEGFEVVGECHDGPSTIDAIRRSKPDLVFLDVQMPGANGFEVVSALGEEELPLFVFVTAFDKYALKAFDVHALDYLLKPFDRDRFLQALARARQQLERPSNSDLRSRLLALVKDLEPAPQRLERFVIKSGGRVFFVRADEIDWIEAAGNYVKLHVGTETHLLRETMNCRRDAAAARDVLPDPPLPHREHRAGEGAAALVQRGVRGVPADGRATHAQPRLPRKAAGSNRPDAVGAGSRACVTPRFSATTARTLRCEPRARARPASPRVPGAPDPRATLRA